MVSVKKMKRVLIFIIIAVLIFSIFSFFATKAIYDRTFKRYDCGATEYPAALKGMVEARTTHRFLCGKNTLTGYLYSASGEDKKDTLIVLAPGHNSCSDNYLWQVYELINLGWSVFSFDATGCCSSKGSSAIGFPQEILDLNAALSYLEDGGNLGFSNIAILGHSRGGYAAVCSLRFNKNVSAVVSVSGINSAMEATLGYAENYVGPLAYGNYGFLWLYQAMLFGGKTASLRADKVLESSAVPVLLIHGQDDTTVPTNKYSIVSHLKENKRENVEIFIRTAPDNSGHTNLLFAKDGTADDEVIEKIDQFLNSSIK